MSIVSGDEKHKEYRIMSDRSLPDILTEDEEKALLGIFNKRYATAERNRLMILLALTTGMRVGDLIGLKWSDIELDTGRTHVKMGKGRKDRVLFIKAEILSELIDLKKTFEYEVPEDEEGLVFKTLTNGPVQAQYLRRMIGAQAKKAGIEKRIHFHLLRHTYLSRFYTEHKDIRATQEVAGHANIATTMIYTHVSGEDIREKMLAMPTPSTPEQDEIEAKKAKIIASAKREILDLDSMLHPDEEDKRKTDAALKRMNI